MTQAAGNISVRTAAGTLTAGSTLTLTLPSGHGVTFDSAPFATITAGGLVLTSPRATLAADAESATFTVLSEGSTPSTITIGPIYYDTAATPVGAVTVAVSASAGTAFDNASVDNATVADPAATTFTAAPPAGSADAPSDIMLSAPGSALPTGGSIVLLSPYATQIGAYRTTWAALPTAPSVQSGGVVLGTPTVNAGPVQVTTPDGGTITAPAQTVAVFPITTGGTAPAALTLPGTALVLGAFVPPGALVSTAVVTSGAGGGGSAVAGNQVAIAVSTRGLGNDTTPPVVVIAPPVAAGGPFGLTFSEPVVGLAADDVVVRHQGDTANLTAAVTACRSATSAPVSCATGPVSSARLMPAAGSVLPGGSYQAVVNPAGSINVVTDLAGNPAATTVALYSPPAAVEESSLSYRWATVASTGAYGGTYTVEHRAGATTTFRFTGSALVWYTVTGRSFGKASVSIDGVSKGTVNLYASGTHTHVAHAYNLAAGSHTFVVRVLGSKGSTHGTGTNVAVDAFAVNGGAIVATPATQNQWAVVSATRASKGHLAEADLKNASASLAFRGTAVSVFAMTCPSCGQVRIAVDGVVKGTFDLYARSTGYGHALRIAGLARADHTVQVLVLHAKRRASTGYVVGIDRIVVTP
jgi:hypothetical protein